VTLVDVLINFVEHNCPRRFIGIKLGIRSRPVELVFVLVSGLCVLVIKSASNTDLQDQLCVGIVVSKSYFTIEALGTYVYSNKPMPDFFDELSHIPKNIIVQIAILAPLLFADKRPFNE
jgi:hypothetical protein